MYLDLFRNQGQGRYNCLGGFREAVVIRVYLYRQWTGLIFRNAWEKQIGSNYREV